MSPCPSANPADQPPATDPEDRKRMLGLSGNLAMLIYNMMNGTTWQRREPVEHDTSSSLTVVSPDGGEYTVSIVMTKPAPEPLPLKLGTIISWQNGNDPYPELARLEDGRWNVFTRGSRGEYLLSVDALRKLIGESGWREWEPRA